MTKDTHVFVTPVTDENVDVLTNIAVANAGTHRWNCVVCGKRFLQAKSRYWKVHESCIEEFRANKDKYTEVKK